MGGKKIQFGLMAGLIVGGGLVFQTLLPRMANNAGLLYLQAEYKLATGDAASALRLIQKAAGSKQATAAPAVPTAPVRARSESCPRVTAVKPTAATTASTAPAGDHLLRVRVPGFENGHVQELVIRIPEIPGNAKAQVEQAQALSEMYVRQAENDRRLAEKMRVLETRLKVRHLPAATPTVPTMPPAPESIQ